MLLRDDFFNIAALDVINILLNFREHFAMLYTTEEFCFVCSGRERHRPFSLQISKVRAISNDKIIIMINNKILNDNRKDMLLIRAPTDPLNVTALVYNLLEVALSFNPSFL